MKISGAVLRTAELCPSGSAFDEVALSEGSGFCFPIGMSRQYSDAPRMRGVTGRYYAPLFKLPI